MKFDHEQNLEDGAPFQGVPLSTEPTSISPVGLLKGDLGTAAAVIKQVWKVCMCCLVGNLGPCTGVKLLFHKALCALRVQNAVNPDPTPMSPVILGQPSS